MEFRKELHHVSAKDIPGGRAGSRRRPADRAGRGMSIKKKLQALAKVAKGGAYGVKFDPSGWAHATDNHVLISASVGSAEDFLADPVELSKAVKSLKRDDSLEDVPLRPGGEDFPVDHDLPSTWVSTQADPFVLKRLFDAVTQCWEGKKADACVLLRFYPEDRVIEVSTLNGAVLGVCRSAVPC